MSVDANQTLGQLIDASAGRDAVHVAVLPAVAAHTLKPGDHVGIQSDGRAGGMTSGTIGIVDPFLTRDVREGDHFWLMLYPRTITSLRHVWSHPSIPEEVSAATSADPDPESVQELKSFAASLRRTYEDLIEAATAYIDTGEYWRGGEEFQDVELPSNFWLDFERVTGKRVRDSAGYFFSCSC